jgi:hypothetical protein
MLSLKEVHMSLMVENEQAGINRRCKPIPGIGDHDAVLIDTLIKPRRPKPARRTIHLWDKANITEFKTEVNIRKVEVAANPEIRFLVVMLQLDKFFQGST